MLAVMKNIKSLYKWCAAILATLLVAGLVFRVRTFLVLFELITAVAVIALIAITSRELYVWYKQNNTQKNQSEDILNKK